MSFVTSFLNTVPPKLAPWSTDEEPLYSGDFYQLNCAVTHGDFPINITWLFNDRPLSYMNGVTVLMQGKRSSSLSIDSVSGQHAGNYTCIGSNVAGSVSHTASLTVKGLFFKQLSFF